MTTSENIKMLLDGGYTRQALKMAENESIAIEESAEGITYTFADGSTFTNIGATLYAQ